MASDGQRISTIGFSAQTPRFRTLGVHPELLTRVQFPNSPNLAPGSYDLLQYGDFSRKTVQKRAQGPNWQQALYTEQMAKIPHSTYKETYEKQKEEQRKLGPGVYEINDFITEADKRPQCKRGALDQLMPRFPIDQPERAPPPGAYGIPDEKLVEKHWQQGGSVPVMEWHKGPRSLPLAGVKIGPGTYGYKSSIDDLINKRTGEKGPYQLFTIDRSAPIKTGHYTTLDTWDLSPDFPSKDYPESVSLAKQLERNPKQGEFSKLARFEKKPSNRLAIEYPGLEPKNSEFPGPGAYSLPRPWQSADFQAKKLPFNSTSSRNDRGSFTQASDRHPVGVGRYNLLGAIRDETIADRRKRPRRRNIPFLSTATRFASSIDEALLSERLQPQNLRSEQRIQLHLTGRVSS